jgi:DHA2 family multidrug resistance protein
VTELTNYFLTHGISDLGQARHEAIVAIGRTVRKQATVMGYSDAFMLVGVALVVSFGLALLLKATGPVKAGEAH